MDEDTIRKIVSESLSLAHEAIAMELNDRKDTLPNPAYSVIATLALAHEFAAKAVRSHK